MTKQNLEVPLVVAEMPSNIALIKYMGKKDKTSNLPSNSSISYTLNGFLSRVEVYKIESTQGHEWAPIQSVYPTNLSTLGRTKYLNHFEKLLKHFDLQGSYRICSGNDFPSDCGLASSASSFAALTQAVGLLAEKIHGVKLRAEELASLSRKGSGSSCRSFFSPWVLWEEETVRPLEFPHGKLSHRVIVTSHDKKAVSSSEAHKKVETSLLFAGRAQRAEHRLARLIEYLNKDEWSQAYEICWAEFKDMHALFETAEPHFTYMNERATRVLNFLSDFWNQRADGPLVTMDAGPNIHLLFKESQIELLNQIESELMDPKKGYSIQWMGSRKSVQ